MYPYVYMHTLEGDGRWKPKLRKIAVLRKHTAITCAQLAALQVVYIRRYTYMLICQMLSYPDESSLFFCKKCKIARICSYLPTV